MESVAMHNEQRITKDEGRTSCTRGIQELLLADGEADKERVGQTTVDMQV